LKRKGCDCGCVGLSVCRTNKEERKKKVETKEADVEVEAASSEVAVKDLLDGITKTREDDRCVGVGAVEKVEVDVDLVRRDVESHSRVLAQRKVDRLRRGCRVDAEGLVDVHLVIELEESHTVKGRRQKGQLARITLHERLDGTDEKQQEHETEQENDLCLRSCGCCHSMNQGPRLFLGRHLQRVISHSKKKQRARKKEGGRKEARCVLRGRKCFVFCVLRKRPKIKKKEKKGKESSGRR
jgi:hypothetical protein